MRSAIQIPIQIQKLIQNNNFLTSTIYDRYDLRDKIRPYEKFIIRQGDLIITNRHIINHRERGLSKAHLYYVAKQFSRNNAVYMVFRDSHVIMPLRDSTILFHSEHGLVIIPGKFENLNFYTFRDSYD